MLRCSRALIIQTDKTIECNHSFERGFFFASCVLRALLLTKKIVFPNVQQFFVVEDIAKALGSYFCLKKVLFVKILKFL